MTPLTPLELPEPVEVLVAPELPELVELPVAPELVVPELPEPVASVELVSELVVVAAVEVVAVWRASAGS